MNYVIKPEDFVKLKANSNILIRITSLSFQVKWLNSYHSKVRDLLGEELIKQEKKNVYQWLLRETEPLG